MQMSPEMQRLPQLCRPEAEDFMPSFRSISGRPYLPELASGSPSEIPCMERFKQGGLDGDDGKLQDFDFAFVYTGSPDGLGPVAADEVISNGRLRPAFPLFGRALVSSGSDLQRHGHCGDSDGEVDSGDSARKAEEPVRVHLSKMEVEGRELSSTLSSSSESDALDRVAADTYCAWTPRSVPPSADPRRKSRSAGHSSSKRWRLRDLVPRRSHSSERGKIVPAAAAEEAGKDVEKSSGGEKSCPTAAAAKKEKGSGGGGVAETDMAAAHHLFYAKAGDRPRYSFLPYRKDLLGLFASSERRVTRRHSLDL